MPRLTETRARNAKLPSRGQTFIWCSEVRGLGVRLTPGSRSWVLQPSWNAKKPRITLGAISVLPLEAPEGQPNALDMARTALRAARAGRDPREALVGKPSGITLAQVWKEYEKAGFPKSRGGGRKRAITIRGDGYRYNAHLAKQIGNEPISDITIGRVQRWLDKLPSEDVRTLSFALLKALLTFAKTRGLGEVNDIKIRTQPSRRRQDFLKAEEMARLDQALVRLIEERPSRLLGFSAIRLLAMTGARCHEILSLRWRSIDFEERVAWIERHKSGENGKTILLSDSAIAVLKGLPRSSSPFVFFSPSSACGHLPSVKHQWELAWRRAQIRRVRIHDLRHSFASLGLANGASLAVIGGLLGHAPGSPETARYAHLLNETKRAALDRIAKAINVTDDS